MANIKLRLNRLEGVEGDYGDVMALIRAGKYYNDLNEAEKRRYCLYRYSDTQHIDELICELTGADMDEHILLTRKPAPTTRDEFLKIVAEVEEIMLYGDYNSPEAKAKREADYERIREIGRKREADYKRGESMSQRPLPWERPN